MSKSILKSKGKNSQDYFKLINTTKLVAMSDWLYFQMFVFCRKYFFIDITLGSTLIWSDTIYQPLRSGRIWHKVNF